MASEGDLEVFIPVETCVFTLPVRSLPSSIIRKMGACPSDRPAAFISPVELRETGATSRPRPLTPGQIFLPVVTSNRTAFRTLRNFLHSGESCLQFSDENSGSVIPRMKNSIILFDTKIFLIEPEAKTRDWLCEKRRSAPSHCEAPPLNTAVKTQVDDITERRKIKDCVGDAEAHGKCAAEVLEQRNADAMKDRGEEEEETQEVLTKDASTNTPRIKQEKEESGETGHANEMTSASGHERKVATAKCRKHLVFAAVQSSSGTDANGTQEKNEVKGQTAGDAVLHPGVEDAKGNECRGQSSRSKSGVEVIDVNDDDRDSDTAHADGIHARRVEVLLEKCDQIKRRINECVTSMAPALGSKRPRHEVAAETSAEHDDLIIVDGPNPHVSGDKPRVNRTSINSHIVDLDADDDDDDDVILNDVQSHGRQNGVALNGCKRRTGEETKFSGVYGTSAKRRKRADDAETTFGKKRSENVAVIPNAQSEVKIINDDDDDGETTLQIKDGECSREVSEVSCCNRYDGTTLDVEHDDDDDDDDEVQMMTAEGVSHKSCSSDTVRNAERRVAPTTLQEDEDVVKIVKRSSENRDAAESKHDVRTTLIHTPAAEGPSSDGNESVKVSEMKKASDEEEPASSSGTQQNVKGVNHGTVSRSDNAAEVGASEAAVGSPATSEHHRFVGQQTGATDQSACRGDASVLSRPTSPPANHEADYELLRGEENISRLQERLRVVKEAMSAVQDTLH